MKNNNNNLQDARRKTQDARRKTQDASFNPIFYHSACLPCPVA
ncbi:MAG: hypothetical protein ABL933_01140 [Methyloglobulus sp.]